MKVKLYAVRDDKAELFNPPVILQNDSIAVRSFADLFSRKDDSIYSSHPSDFAIYYLGEMDNESGKLFPVHALKIVARGSDFVNNSDKE